MELRWTNNANQIKNLKSTVTSLTLPDPLAKSIRRDVPSKRSFCQRSRVSALHRQVIAVKKRRIVHA
ncbi:hypothetical protein LSPH24S_03989 [Lysinibacillus sphaericus]